MSDFEPSESQKQEWHAFAAAVRGGDVESARRLLGQSAFLREHINYPAFDFGRRAAHIAAKDIPMLEMLMSFGADIHLRSDWQQGPYTVLDEADDASARFLISRGADLRPTAAARLGWFDELQALIAAQPESVNERGGDGQQPLHQAKTVEIADYLVDHGAGIDTPCIDHKSTPAQYALAERPEVCRRLLERGARPDIFMAARLGDAALAERLIDADRACVDARINVGGYDPVPPFHIYCWSLGFLLSPHDVALKFGHRDVYDLLIRRSSPKTRLLHVAMAGDEAGARAALEADPGLMASLSAADHGQLAQAIFVGNFAGAETMLRLGFDPLATGTDTGTALHMACWMGSVRMVEQLVALPNAPINTKEPTHGGTPLGWAIFGSEHRCAQGGDYGAVVERMIAAGADLAGVSPMGSAAVRAALARHGIA